MKTADVDILLVPGWSDSGPDHWQSRWERRLKTARRVVQDDWLNPQRDAWVEKILDTVAACQRPVVLVGHSLGVAAIVHAGQHLTSSKVVGAYLVGPADVENSSFWPVTAGVTWEHERSGFAPLPHTALPFASVLVASSDDLYCTINRARALAAEWGSILVEAGACGHLNTQSGHGPWPEGLLRFGVFLKDL
jgi:predicted alpha/beta hydrolase family esterase